MQWSEFRSERRKRGKPFVVAHRGAPLVAPENTLRAFQLALEQGAFALETDLRFSADDQIVLHHDATLERTTNGSGYVRDHTLHELKQLRTRPPAVAGTGSTDSTGSTKADFSNEPIPTLEELIELTGGETPLLLELKDPLFRDRQYARRLIDLLERQKMTERTAIISFEPSHVATLAALCPTIPTGFITLTNPWPRSGTELLGPVWPLLFLNPGYVRLAHRRNGVVCPLDTTPERRMKYYLWLQVDAVLADDPAAALAAMGG